MNTSSVDWTSVINNTIAQVPSWYAMANHQPIPVQVPQNTYGGAVQFGPSGVAASISPGLILAGVVAVVAVVFLLKR